MSTAIGPRPIWSKASNRGRRRPLHDGLGPVEFDELQLRNLAVRPDSAGITPFYNVTARRQDGVKGYKLPDLHKSLSIRQAFAPVWQFSAFPTFGFPRSQWPVRDRAATHGGGTQGFLAIRPETAASVPFITSPLVAKTA